MTQKETEVGKPIICSFLVGRQIRTCINYHLKVYIRPYGIVLLCFQNVINETNAIIYYTGAMARRFVSTKLLSH